MEINRGWVVVDVETTGTDPQTCRMLSVAALALTPDGRVVDTMSTLLSPGVDPGPTHIHGLTAAVLAGAPQFGDVSAELAAVVRGRTLVAHNAAFDFGFLAAEARRGAARAARRAPASAPWNWQSASTSAWPNLKLATLADHYGIAQLHPHDALDDASVLARIFHRMLTDASNNAFAPCPSVPRPPRPAGCRPADAPGAIGSRCPR